MDGPAAEDRVYLPDLPRAMRELGHQTNYSRCYSAVVGAAVPAGREGRRWYVRKDDLEEVRAGLVHHAYVAARMAARRRRFRRW